MKYVFSFCLVFVCGLCLLASVEMNAVAAPRRPVARRPQPKLPDLKSPEDKRRFLEMIRGSYPALKRGGTQFRASDLDKGLERDVAKATNVPFGKVIDDETFVRRVFIDTTGRFPSAERVTKFVADSDPKKREKLIDELLQTDAFARKWARYWRSVVFFESNANKNSVNPQAMEEWFFTEFKKGTSWDRMVGELISATPKRKPKVKPQENGWNQNTGSNNFILACERKPEVIASQTARLFMGVSIGCAECHDHPFDDWKREQFHELAAFFAPGKYYMTDQDDPTEKSVMPAKFLLGEVPPPGLKPDQLRVAAAAYLVYNPDNYWFARAYVNRMWSELVGDGFYSVDSLGPDKDVVHKLIVNRLAASFRTEGFDTKWLFRTLLNSRAYQREIRTISDDAELFTAVRPSRLRPYEVADNVEQLLGENNKLKRDVNSAFAANPSIPQRELEGSIQQALLLMNSSVLNQRLAGCELRKRLSATKDNREVVRDAFLGVLARRPTEVETNQYIKMIKESENRYEGIVDLLWVLVNSAEFVTKT